MCKPVAKPKNSLGAGILSVVVMFMLTFLGIYGIKLVQDPAHFASCTTNGPALWAQGNFYFSTFGGLIGALYELYLVLIGKVFEVETIPIIPKIRGLNAGYIFTVGLIFDAFMVIGTGDAELLNGVVFFLAIVGPLLAPGLALQGLQKTVAIVYFGGMTVVSMIIILKSGIAHGGTIATYLLAANKLSSAAASILTPPDKGLRNNIQFHVLRFIGNCMLTYAYVLSTDESSCFPQEAGAQISPKLLPAFGASAGLGLMLQLHLNTKSAEKRTYMEVPNVSNV